VLLRENLVEVLAAPAVIRPNLAFCRRVVADFHRDISYPKYGVFMHDRLLLIDNNVRKVFDWTDRHIDGLFQNPQQRVENRPRVL
jgi:hypothetical protein